MQHGEKGQGLSGVGYPESDPVVEVRGLEFAYGAGGLVLKGIDLRVERGARCLLWPNGAGKTTLLNVLGGRHMVAEDAVRVLGRSAFHDTGLATRIAHLSGNFPFDVDVEFSEVLGRQAGVDPERRDRLLEILGVDPAWHMHRVSDGQRRRVQILLGLLRPPEVILLDEVTSDLDVLARADFLRFLRSESEDRNATILYATHVMDGMEAWATHLAYMEGGRIRHYGEVPRPLLATLESWMRRSKS